MTTATEQFKVAVRGIATSYVARALCAFTPGIDWRGSTRERMAQAYERNDHSLRTRVDLSVLRLKARGLVPTPKWASMTKAQQQRTLSTMRTHGGSFASALAEAWSLADSNNSTRLGAAFDDLVSSYGPTSAYMDKELS